MTAKPSAITGARMVTNRITTALHRLTAWLRRPDTLSAGQPHYDWSTR